MAVDLIDPSPAGRTTVAGDGLSVAERAAADARWAYGHVIVDEAQELSAMAWRALMRRCPSRSMTLVGDVAQTSAPAGTTSWGAALRPYVADRWPPQRADGQLPERRPRSWAVAADVLRDIDPTLAVPTNRSVRSARRPGVESGTPEHLGWRTGTGPSTPRSVTSATVGSRCDRAG